MKCPKCGALNADNAEFCGLCHEAFISESPDSARQEPAAEDHKIEQTKNEKPSHQEPIPSNSTDWLYPAILSTVIALLFTLMFPMAKISIGLSIGKIMFASIILGSVVSSAGAIKSDFKLSLTGWFLGLSSSFLAFNLMFFSSFLLFRIKPNLVSNVASAGVVFIAASLSLAICFYITLEKLSRFKTLLAALIIFVASLLTSLVIYLLGLNPLAITVFLAWPSSFYIVKRLSKQLSG